MSAPRVPAVTRLMVEADWGEVFTLQRAAFVDEARLYETPAVPALEATFAETCDRLRSSISWVAVSDQRIIGAVSLREYRPGGPDVERLMVAPDRRGEGIGRDLLDVVEVYCLDHGFEQVQLIVGDVAVDNQAIYQHLGWDRKSTHTLDGFDDVVLHTMGKALAP